MIKKIYVHYWRRWREQRGRERVGEREGEQSTLMTDDNDSAIHTTQILVLFPHLWNSLFFSVTLLSHPSVFRLFVNLTSFVFDTLNFRHKTRAMPNNCRLHPFATHAKTLLHTDYRLLKLRLLALFFPQQQYSTFKHWAHIYGYPLSLSLHFCGQFKRIWPLPNIKVFVEFNFFRFSFFGIANFCDTNTHTHV